jgi:hypothetical protein
MIVKYTNCDISKLEEVINDYLSEGYKIIHFSIFGCLAHIIFEVPEVKKTYKKKVKNDNL